MIEEHSIVNFLWVYQRADIRCRMCQKSKNFFIFTAGYQVKMLCFSAYIRFGLLFLLMPYAPTLFAKDFREFRVQHFGDDVLPQSSINDIYSDRSGYLWISTHMGLVRYDGQVFQTFTPQNNANIKNIRSQFFLQDTSGNLYMNDGSGFYILEHGNPRFLSFNGPPNMFLNYIYARGKSNPFSQHQFRAPPGSFWFYEQFEPGFRKHIVYALGKDSVVYETHTFNSFFMLDGYLVTFSKEHKPVMFRPGKADNRPVPLIIAGDLAKTIRYDESLWKLIRFNKGSETYIFYDSAIYHMQLKGDSLYGTVLVDHIPITGIGSFHVDEHNGYYALGTVSDGIYLLFPRSFSVRLLDGGDQPNLFYAVQPVKDQIYMNSKGYLFNLYTAYQKRFVGHMAQYALLRDGLHIMATSYGGAWKYDVHTGSYKRFDHGGWGWLQSAVVDRSGRHWIATPGNIGLLMNDSVAWFWPGKGVPWARDRNDYYTETIFLKDSNTLWAGTRARTYAVDMTTHAYSEIPGMKARYIRNMLEDKGGVWLLSYGNGYYYYKHGKEIKMPLDREGYLSTPHTMLLDRNGFYWISTNRGLFRVSRAGLFDYIEGRSTGVRYEYFDRRFGFLTNEFNGGCFPCGYRMSDSLFLLPSMKGLVYFNPLNVVTAPLDNLINIDKVIIDGKRQQISSSYNVSADFTSFRCDVSSPYFGSLENMVLDYKIDGYGKNWRPLINNRYLECNRLPHGFYTIRIRKLVDFATGRTMELAIRFHVATPWYLRGWFILLGIFTGIGLMWLFIRLRLRLLRLQKQRLEVQVQERTTQLNALVHTLEQSQAELYQSYRFREQLTSIVLHDIQTPLRFLKRVVKHLRSTHTEMDQETLHDELEDLYFSTAEVASYSEDFLVWIKSQKDAFEITYKDVNLLAMLEDIHNLYHKVAASKGTTIQVACPEDITLHTDPALFSIIVRNLTDNAVKYAEDGHIVISGERMGDYIVVKVKDDGIGMTAEQINKIMQEDGENTVIAVGKLGYQFIKDLLRILGGSLRIISEPGAGTEIYLLFSALRSDQS